MEKLLNKRLTTIAEKVAQFKKLDPNFKVFGSGKHRYAFNAVADLKMVESFETHHRIKLPAEYKLFITQVGNGGAGPYYGVRPLEDFAAHYIHHEAPPASICLHRPFPDQYWLSETTIQITSQITLESACGTISICEEGSGYNHLLVVCGKERDHVWFDGCVTNQGMIPFSSPEKDRFSFLDWYETWLDMVEQSSEN